MGLVADAHSAGSVEKLDGIVELELRARQD
jgi:hypothetical protein